ncbi:chemotaxis protein CheW [Parashewanella spongiae]|uniref:Chemotaxis protein CheW n=1 Tax=Parashewanella spongiae TaxID=342950 RepID=A0A3A6TQH3_9GAMM|nr:chemotaxis protein CheW [Parashewanella spongiae]MCL1077666.1 chemotaxis protein CheW [Parashewanella spongiae]RJY18248.1 chemotaxis protein CheW [Parashewanella spongiae]
MTSLIDEPVVDFFSVLLKEPTRENKAHSHLVKQKLEVTTDEVVVKTDYKDPLVQKQSLENLLSQVSVLEQVTEIENKVKETQENAVEVKIELNEPSETLVERNQANQIELLDNEFQVLFFKVAGLVLAIPLVCLGGIIKLEKVNKLIGKPDWFKGIQNNREQQINVVDTAAWVMPEKYTNELKTTISYQYVVLLEGSRWGLACESLLNADKVEKSQVNWRKKIGKRPWLAGVVKKQMCGILNVQSLIELLDNGMNCQDSVD